MSKLSQRQCPSRFRLIYNVLVVLVVVLIICFNRTDYWYYSWNNRRIDSEGFKTTAAIEPKPTTKTILLWTEGWGSPAGAPFPSWAITNQTLSNCSSPCQFTANRSLLNSSHALVFHEMYWQPSFAELLKQPRNSNQIWTFFRWEPPTKTSGNKTALDPMFNWTLTYRQDSDLFAPYGTFVNIDSSAEPRTDISADIGEPIPTIDSLRNKSLVAWMHTNCGSPSKRDLIAQKLMQYVKVDDYGSCGRLGRLSCGQGPPETDTVRCFKELGKKYKFYLSFENSLCPDYLTEKFFLPLKYGMLPILHAHPSVKRFIPAGSFIDLFAFAKIEDLANHLKYLDANPEEYLKYFEWRKFQRAVHPADDYFWCSLCTKLHEEPPQVSKSYSSIYDWFYQNYSGQEICNSEQLKARIQSMI